MSTHNALERIASDKFSDLVGFILPPGPLRQVLQKSEDVRKLRSLILYGEINEFHLRSHIGRLLAEFQVGHTFRHDLALAALAVAVEQWNHPFSEEYLIDLARIERPEFPASSRIARECLKARLEYPKTRISISPYPRLSHFAQSIKNIYSARLVRPYPASKITRNLVRYAEVSYAKH